MPKGRGTNESELLERSISKNRKAHESHFYLFPLARHFASRQLIGSAFRQNLTNDFLKLLKNS